MGKNQKNRSSALSDGWKQTKVYRQLKKDMLDDLHSRGLIGRQYQDKVEEYMDFWCVLQKLKQDIAERGVYVTYQNGANQMGTTDNKSIDKAAKISAQMLNIFTALGFKDQALNSKMQNSGEEDEL